MMRLTVIPKAQIAIDSLFILVLVSLYMYLSPNHIKMMRWDATRDTTFCEKEYLLTCKNEIR